MFASSIRVAVVTLAASLLSVDPLAGQGPVGSASRSPTMSRAELTAMAARAEQEAASASKSDARKEKQAEAAALRERLQEGDFRVGDRIYLSVTSEGVLADTFVVRENRVVILPGVGEIALRGVLRSELQDYMTVQLARFYRNPTVRAQALVRLQMTGGVGKPGFYDMPTDVLLSDAIMRAGGPTSDAKMDKTVIKRGSAEVWRAPAANQAIREGKTLDQLSLRAGDEVVVGQKKRSKLDAFLAYGGAIAGILFAVIYFADR